MKRTLIATAISLALAGIARAEVWAPLDVYVKKCAVIVKARTVAAHDDWRELAITEVWVGSLDDLELNDKGNYVTHEGEHGVHVKTGQEIVVFFSRDNHPKGKLRWHSTAFPIVDGKLIYGATSDTEYAEYTVEEFKRKVLEIANTH
jgi:hypothetical protein